MTSDSVTTNTPRRPIPIGTDQCVIPDPLAQPTLPPLPQYRRFPWDPLQAGSGAMYVSAQTHACHFASLGPR